MGLKEVLDHHKAESITFSEILTELESQIEYRRQNQSHAVSFPPLFRAFASVDESPDRSDDVSKKSRTVCKIRSITKQAILSINSLQPSLFSDCAARLPLSLIHI